MGYKVIKAFTDGQDNMYVYQVGDEYPRKGYSPTEDRINGLLGTGNKQGVPLIEKVVLVEDIVATDDVVAEAPRKHRRKKG